ncbi:hypothetical protein [Halosolutus gelatinilyticus]|uniref:hypothetical protein n=1 Tax=Halosolutus gelatinilyticus TaxID=2931975 RepID=UPI001FF6729E|nr:hypothetical protein [Halosolutus gelatinilyticus]
MADRAPSTPEQAVDRWDTVFDALRAEPRRRLVDALLEVAPDEPVRLPEAAVSPIRPVDPDALWIQLHHHHLPLLADAKYVRWESAPLRAYRGPRFTEVAFVFESIHENADQVPQQLDGGSPIPDGY